MNTVHSLIVKSLLLLFIIDGYFSLNQSSLEAREVEGLFEISVVVEDQNNSTRRLATRQALLDVIIRISGQSTAASNSILQSSLKKSTAYLQRYLYREVDTIDQQGNTSKQLMLDLVFDEMAIRNLLRTANLPRWGANRPQVLLWIAIGDQQQRFLLDTDDQAMLEPLNLQQIITDKAAIRGLPLLLPLMDLEDSVSLDVADVWGRFIAPIRQASERYTADAIVAAQVIRQEQQWLTRWLLLHKGRTISWELQSDSIESALAQGVDTIADRLAAQYAVYEDSEQRDEVLLSVNNVLNLEDFANLMTYIQSITSINRVDVAKVSGSVIHLKADLIGTQEAFIQAISLNNLLVVESTPLVDSSSVQTQLPDLYFHWNGVTPRTPSSRTSVD